MVHVLHRRTLLLLTALLSQLVAGAVGIWLLADLGHRGETAYRDRYTNLAAMANLHTSLADAERAILFAVIQGDRLHPDVPVAFHACIDRARQECRVARVNAAIPGEAAEVEQLAAQIEEMDRRGNALLTAPASERLGRYNALGAGFQAAVTAAWRHLSAIRAMNEVAIEDSHRTTREMGRWAVGTFACVGGLSLLLTAVAVWLLLRGLPRPVGSADIPTANPDRPGK